MTTLSTLILLGRLAGHLGRAYDRLGVRRVARPIDPIRLLSTSAARPSVRCRDEEARRDARGSGLRPISASYLEGESWLAWKVLLIAIMGEQLTDDERVVSRPSQDALMEPLEIVREFWAIIGRRGGKSRATAVLGAYIAACCDHRGALAPGEIGVLPILAASTRQAQQLYNFMAGIFATVPRFSGLVNDSTGDTLRLATGVNIMVAPASGARSDRSPRSARSPTSWPSGGPLTTTALIRTRRSLAR